LQVGTGRGIEGSLYYLFAYTFMVIGSFAVITVVGGPGDRAHSLDRYRGLARRSPWLAGSLAVLLVAQAGVPFTTGFLAKLEVVSASVGGGSTALAVVAMVSAAIAAFFYLRLVLLMYSATEPSPTAAPALSAAGTGAGPGAMAAASEVDAPAGEPVVVLPAMQLAIGLCLVVTVLFGLWPAPLVDFAHQATLLFR
ncbi:MAG TPA: proton-conducting transporter membrane subunit, partial [Acidimicrobiales bacterium]|nr:proton-conducting transporter membrane subunit [Acidimicrobiales bacterium]